MRPGTAQEAGMMRAKPHSDRKMTGATGGKSTAQGLHAAQRRGAKRGIVSMCIGGGMGAAGLYEML